MGAHLVQMHYLAERCRPPALGVATLLVSLAGCSVDENSSGRRSPAPGATTTGADPAGAGAGTTTTGSGSTTTGGSGTSSGSTTNGSGGSGTGAPGSATGAGGTGPGGSGTGAGGSAVGGAGSGSGGAGPGQGTPTDAGGPGTGPAVDASRPPGMPAGAEKIGGLELMHRIVGKWTGMNQSGPLNGAFPMTVDFALTGPGFIFGVLQLDPQNNVAWGFNIETYGGKDVLAYRNGGFLGGAKRDTRLSLVEYDTAKGYYRFCAVKEQGFPVDGCNYIEAKYTFSAPDKMIFNVTTRAGKPHVHWDATRIETHPLPDPFPASIASQGQGEAKWPPGAGL